MTGSCITQQPHQLLRKTAQLEFGHKLLAVSQSSLPPAVVYSLYIVGEGHLEF